MGISGSKFVRTNLDSFEANWILESCLDPSLHLGFPNLHSLPIVQQHLPSFFFCWCTKVRSRDPLASWRRGEPRPLPATVWCLHSHTASIQLAQCTASSFAVSGSGARPTSWRRDEAQARPHRLLVCALPSYTYAVGCIFFLIETFPPPCKLTSRLTMTADPLAFWCLYYRARRIQLRCTFFFRIEISSAP